MKYYLLFPLYVLRDCLVIPQGLFRDCLACQASSSTKCLYAGFPFKAELSSLAFILRIEVSLQDGLFMKPRWLNDDFNDVDFRYLHI